MPTSAAVPAEAPVMISWSNYQATEEYENAKRWAVKPEHTQGSLWAAFYAGFFACAVRSAETALTPPTDKDAARWRPITEIETTLGDKPMLRCIVVTNLGAGLIVGEAEFHGEDDGWWWAGERGSYHGERIYPTQFQPLPLPPEGEA